MVEKIFIEALSGSFNMLIKIAMIVIPLMVVLEVAKELRVLEKWAKPLEPLMGFLGMQKEAAFPLLAGLVFGLAYGAGLIIDSAREGILKHKDLVLISIFLVICHSLIEDTLLFVAIGAKGTVLIIYRLILALTVTFFVSRLVKFN
ncbi:MULTISPECIES: nucleoside recognition domain-containing protein [Carboxydothermus]|uniref:Nucleoside transporter/FeoB GTPase Gate domain-containing protein n=1 Tax=Carboxydothermus ferrireducens DSM 11255 TaxID=1119529 RepID=A0ABX2RD83_9THEO|nr:MULTISPECIES: nucleoside recognition domain-containing protein [Carboxydothermus]NYE58824.1 hypothetical protein [Carboxydothermus ferrireducens DSM 11255]